MHFRHGHRGLSRPEDRAGPGIAEAAGAGTLAAMPDDELDPGASTQMFQAFVDRTEEPGAPRLSWAWIAFAVIALAIVVAAGALLLGS